MSGEYSNIMSANSNLLMSSLIFGCTYFIVLFSPIVVYMKSYFSKDDKPILAELIGKALVIQLGLVFLFTILGIFIETVSISGNDIKPTKAFPLFFGNGNELLDVYWSGYLNQFMSDSSSSSAFGSEGKGVGFMAGKYIGILYKLIILAGYLAILWIFIASYFKQRAEAERQNSQIGTIQILFSFLFSSIGTILILITHSNIASMYPAYFGMDSDAVGINFIKYSQTVVSSIFYTSGGNN